MKKYSKFLFILFIFFLSLINSCKKKEESQKDAEVNYSGVLINPNVSFPIYSLPSGGAVSIPSSFDLAYLMPSVRNQGPQGSCVAFALAYLKSYQEKVEKGYNYSDNTKIMSPAFIYNQVKLPGTCEEAGSYVNEALDFLVINGCATENDFGYNINNCTNLPNSIIKEKAKINKIKNWKGFNFLFNNDILDELKYAISQQQPIVIAYKVDIEFSKPSLFSWGDFIWKENNSGDPYVNGVRKAGYHCSLLVGYDDSKNAFKLLNSWGSSWKIDGYCWVDYQWFLKRVNAAMVTFDESNNGGNTGSKINITGSCPANVPIGNSQSFNMSISNTGDKPFTITDLLIDDNASAAFSFSTGKPSLPIIISAGGSLDVNLKFSPLSAQLYSSTLRVVSDATSGTNTSSLTGMGSSNNPNTSIVRLSKTTCNNTIINTNTSFTINVYNDGNQPFTVNNIVSSNSAFSVNNFTQQSVLSNSFVTYTINFLPTAIQEYNTVLTVISNANSGTNTISVNAFGLTNGGGGGVTSNPSIGNYTTCNYANSSRSFGNIDPMYSGPYITNVYRVKVQSIDLTTNKVTLVVKRCDGLNIQNNIWIRMVDLTNTGNWQKTFFQQPNASEAVFETELPGSLVFSGHDNRNYVFLVEEKFIDYSTDVLNLTW